MALEEQKPNISVYLAYVDFTHEYLSCKYFFYLFTTHYNELVKIASWKLEKDA